MIKIATTAEEYNKLGLIPNQKFIGYYDEYQHYQVIVHNASDPKCYMLECHKGYTNHGKL